MARFARAAMDKFCTVVRDLELKLGPDTGGTYRQRDNYRVLASVNS